jgi:endoglycosylceramidase
MRRLRLPLILAALVGLPSAAGAADPTLPLNHTGRWITDAAGRVVVLHGINQVYKVAPYLPATDGFSDDDAAFLAANGLNAVRVGVIWKAVEPHPGVYDDGYLAGIRSTVDALARHGIVSLLDFHQDLFNERFQGEGAPDWAIQDDGLPNPRLGFPGNYLANPALERALDHFFNNDPGPGGIGLQDRYAAAWAHVAQNFRGDAAVLGYEILNEPFPGTAWQQCASPAGCPVFDAKLTAFYRRVARAIRTIDPTTLVSYEPNVLFNDGADTQLAPIDDGHALFSFHDYCLSQSSGGSYSGCAPFDDTVFANAVKHVASTGDGLLETEWGSTDDGTTLQANVTRADQNMVGWLEWAYTGHDITSTGSGDAQALVLDPAQPPAGANVKTAKLKLLAEPHPEVVAGTPTRISYDPADSTFNLAFSTARAAGGSFPAGAETEIALPSIEYPSGYAASVTGGALLSTPGDPQLRIASCPGASAITVTVMPTGTSHGSCVAHSLGANGLPRCGSQPAVVFAVHRFRGHSITRVNMYVNGRRIVRRRGRALRSVTLPALPGRARRTVRIDTYTRTGLARRTTRTVSGCGARTPARAVHVRHGASHRRR